MNQCNGTSPPTYLVLPCYLRVRVDPVFFGAWASTYLFWLLPPSLDRFSLCSLTRPAPFSFSLWVFTPTFDTFCLPSCLKCFQFLPALLTFLALTVPAPFILCLTRSRPAPRCACFPSVQNGPFCAFISAPARVFCRFRNVPLSRLFEEGLPGCPPPIPTLRSFSCYFHPTDRDAFRIRQPVSATVPVVQPLVPLNPTFFSPFRFAHAPRLWTPPSRDDTKGILLHPAVTGVGQFPRSPSLHPAGFP